MTDGVSRGFVAQQQRKRVNEDGFSGAGLAGQEVEAGGELDGDVVNDRVVFDPQFQQHVSSRLSEVKRSVARGKSRAEKAQHADHGFWRWKRWASAQRKRMENARALAPAPPVGNDPRLKPPLTGTCDS